MIYLPQLRAPQEIHTQTELASPHSPHSSLDFRSVKEGKFED